MLKMLHTFESQNKLFLFNRWRFDQHLLLKLLRRKRDWIFDSARTKLVGRCNLLECACELSNLHRKLCELFRSCSEFL